MPGAPRGESGSTGAGGTAAVAEGGGGGAARRGEAKAARGRGAGAGTGKGTGALAVARRRQCGAGGQPRATTRHGGARPWGAALRHAEAQRPRGTTRRRGGGGAARGGHGGAQRARGAARCGRGRPVEVRARGDGSGGEAPLYSARARKVWEERDGAQILLAIMPAAPYRDGRTMELSISNT
ncbi:uncharacterized protein, partial [Miscanthus floridulus]|uniref:uncharacterized protein n=1 Tax=Miscanthus floridulus TaxID=154761 RepID=UPI00345B23AA